MRVVLHVVGHAIVDDVRQIIDVQAASRHVGCHEELYPVAAETLHGQVALLLGEVAVECVGIVSIADQIVRHLLCLQPSAAEDDGIDARIVIDNAFEGVITVARVYHIIYMVYVLRPFVATAHLYLCGVGQVVLCDALYFLAHRSTEEERAMLAGDAFEDAVEVFLEAHREHLVRLVEHDVAHFGEVGHTTLHQVHQSAGRGDDDVHAVLQGTYLRLDVRAAIYGKDAYVGQILAESLQVVRYLQAELACRAEDEDRPTPALP